MKAGARAKAAPARVSPPVLLALPAARPAMKLGFLLLVLLAVPARAQTPEPAAFAGPTWVEVAWLDPWTGENVSTDAASGAAVHTLTLGADGRFVEDREGGCCRRTGAWTLDEDRLTLRYDDAPPVVFRVAKAEPDVLQLGARGREGEVIHTFAPRP